MTAQSIGGGAMALDADRSAVRPVMTDVARLAGVSQKTVSRVINNAPNVSPDVRKRVDSAVAAVGYRPNSAARALVTKRTRVIGIITPGTALYGPSAQLFGVERAAWQAGYSVVIVSTAGSTRAELERAIDRVADAGCPAVVAPDQRSGARLATEHLLSLGHRTVWHVAGPGSWYSASWSTT